MFYLSVNYVFIIDQILMNKDVLLTLTCDVTTCLRTNDNDNGVNGQLAM